MKRDLSDIALATSEKGSDPDCGGRNIVTAVNAESAVSVVKGRERRQRSEQPASFDEPRTHATRTLPRVQRLECADDVLGLIPCLRSLTAFPLVYAHSCSLTALATSFLLTGCMVGPNYHGPPPETTADFPIKYKNCSGEGHWRGARPSDTEGAGDWWRVFSDPTLNRLETQAYTANQNIRLAVDRIDDAAAQVQIAAADLYPNVNLASSATRSRTTATGPVEAERIVGRVTGLGGGNSSGPTPVYTGSNGPVFTGQPISLTSWDFQIPGEMRWELDLFGRIRRNVEAARAETEQAKADFAATLLSVTASVAADYFVLRALDAQVVILDRTIASRQDALQIAEERFEAGLVNELDVVRARSDLASDQAELFNIQRSRAEMENAIGTLTGQLASNLHLLPGTIAYSAPRIPAGLPSRLLERRPDVAAAERSVATANARIGAAVAAFYPDVTINGAAGFETANIGDIFAGQSLIWSLGPSITVPIFEGFRLKAGLRSSKAQYRETVDNYRNQVLSAFEDVENALADIRTLAGQYEAQQRAVDSETRALELSQQQYDKGAVTFLDVLDAERTLLSDEQIAAQLAGARLQATVRLIKSIGGRWDRQFSRPP
jgi:outer membrane protein, multidrug efflux system